MKKILLIIFIPVFIILSIPALILGFGYDSSSWDDFDKSVYDTESDGVETFYQSLETALDTYHEGDEDDDLIISLHQDVVNQMIYDMFRADNESYAPQSECESAECKSASIIELNDSGSMALMVKGAWLGIESNSPGIITFNVALAVGRIDGFSYSTTLKVSIGFEDADDEYILSFDSMRLGRIPVPDRLIREIVSATDSNLEATDDAFVNFDEDNLALRLNKQGLIDSLREEENDDAMLSLIAEMLSIVFERELLRFAFDQNALDMRFGVYVLRSDDDEDIPAYLYDLHDEQGYNPESFNASRFMETRFNEYVFNRALSGETRYKLSEEDLNKMIYDEFDGFEDFRVERELSDNGRIMSVGLSAMWFEFDEAYISVHALMEIDSIKSKLLMEWEVLEQTDTEIEYKLSSVSIGSKEGKTEDEYILIDEESDRDRLESFRAFFADLGDVEFVMFDEDGNLHLEAQRLEKFMEEGTVEDNLKVESIEVVEEGIYIELTASNETLDLVLSSFTTSLNSVFMSPDLLNDLNDTLNPEAGSIEETLINKVDSIQSDLNTLGEVSSDDVNELFDIYETLDETSQDAFMDTIEGSIDPGIFEEFSDLF